MATKKATTTSDLSADDLTASAQDPSPTREDLVAGIEENSSAEVLAKSDDVKYVKVKNPFSGDVTTVPESIVDTLTDSGYSKSK